MKIALHLQYKGARYHGWQKQPQVSSIQTRVEHALSQIAQETIRVYCAGRTDAGVHATTQIIHFETNVTRSLDAWMLGTNTYLPEDIRVIQAFVVADEFHARFSAVARSYQYVIHNTPFHSALFHDLSTWVSRPLNIELMNEAAQYLLGEHDFSAFRSSECQSKSPVRKVLFIEVKRQTKFVIVDIKANAFLHHMVRNIVGVLLLIGKERKEVAWMKEVLETRDRRCAAETAPAQGLYLVGVDYPEKLGVQVVEENVLFW